MKIFLQNANATTEDSKWQWVCSANAKCGLIGVALPSQHDSPARLFEAFIQLLSHLNDSTVVGWFRLALALIVATIVCARNHAALRHKTDHGALISLQWIFALGILFLVLALPIPQLNLNPAQRAFIFAVSLAAVAILPWRLSKLMLPIAGHQRVLATGIYLLISIVLLLNSFN